MKIRQPFIFYWNLALLPFSAALGGYLYKDGHTNEAYIMAFITAILLAAPVLACNKKWRGKVNAFTIAVVGDFMVFVALGLWFLLWRWIFSHSSDAFVIPPVPALLISILSSVFIAFFKGMVETTGFAVLKGLHTYAFYRMAKEWETDDISFKIFFKLADIANNGPVDAIFKMYEGWVAEGWYQPCVLGLFLFLHILFLGFAKGYLGVKNDAVGKENGPSSPEHFSLKKARKRKGGKR